MASNETPSPKALKTSAGLLKLNGAVRHYEWGGFDFIPSLLGIENRERRPYAELWMGAHPSGPSTVEINGAAVSLAQLIETAPDEILGPSIAARFGGRLPYLFKVLDARKMLSIQAHPTLEQAREGFARENAAGIPIDAPHRNYKDANHKPEVHVALTDFWMLHGFRPLEEIAAALESVPELRELTPDFANRLKQAGRDRAARQALLRELYRSAMIMPQERVDAILKPLIERLHKMDIRDKDDPSWWAVRAAEDFPLPGGHVDRGIFSIYLLNLVRLKPGQGTYQPAGTLHAYLEGVNVELMANSDNVLRGGLTPKHVDVAELMRILNFIDGAPEVLEGESASATETVYRTPAAEFELSRLLLSADQKHASAADHSAEILIVLEGDVAARSSDTTLDRRRGDIVLAPHGVSYMIESRADSALLFKAAPPLSSAVA